jgi:hypothetical protein
MKLTRADKDAFTSAVVQDIPKIDYEEQYRKLVYEDAISQLPEKIQAIAKDVSLNRFLATRIVWGRGSLGTISVFAARESGEYKPSSTEVASKINALVRASREQEDRLVETQRKVRGAIEPCTTLKMALERLPEFAKYLPEPRAKSVNLPAIANLVADLSTLGWPKDKTVE